MDMANRLNEQRFREAIKKFEIVPDQWTVENGCLTQSLKIKRKVCN